MTTAANKQKSKTSLTALEIELLAALTHLHQLVTLETDMAFHPANVKARAVIDKTNSL